MPMSMDRTVLAKLGMLLCIGAGALAAGSAADGTASAPHRALVFKLKEKHGSGASGTATLAAVRRDMRVVIRLTAPAGDGFLAHIHTGPCKREPTFANPRIHLSLNNVVKGRSVTTLRRTRLRSLRARTFSINVHDPSTYGVIACGDIPRAT
jgi:hypothetical protein